MYMQYTNLTLVGEDVVVLVVVVFHGEMLNVYVTDRSNLNKTSLIYAISKLT
jgi:hypothetical protein